MQNKYSAKKTRFPEIVLKLMAISFLFACLQRPVPVLAAQRHVVCIDAGHGGENTGAQYLGLDEKNLTIVIAQAMKEELSLYEDVDVVMTRTDDRDLSLAERAQIGADAGAEFLFSIHLNASEEHTAYGTEVWVPSEGKYYAESRSFGEIVATDLCNEFHTYNRGVKTKRSFKKAGEYYGILKNAVKNGMNAAIIEHCHMDEIHDKEALFGEDSLQRMGRVDATAVAKYLGLKSKALGVDYGDYPKPSVRTPKKPVFQDTTPPENVSVCLLGVNREAGVVLLEAEAKDEDSKVLYYNVSKDGGKTWSTLKKWTSEKPCTILLSLDNKVTDVRIRFWNRYDLWTEAETILIGGR